MQKGADLGMKYYTGFFIEKALSIDNVFVISLIFTYFAIPPNTNIAPSYGVSLR
jgi:tellurite resistance protein TerC